VEIFQLVGRIAINRGEISAELRGVESEAQSVGQRMGESFQRVGDKLNKALIAGAAAAGAALVGMGVAGVKAFADFEKGMNEVFTLLPGLDQQIREDLTQGVKDLSEELGILPKEVVPALYQAISAGIPKDNVLDFLRTAGKAAIGGVTDLKTSVDGLTSVVNAYGAETLSAARASDIMFTAVKLGKTTMEEFSASLFQVAPIAAQLGVSFEEVSAWMAQLTLQGTPTSVAMTQIRAALVALTNDSSDASKIFQELTGKSFPEFIAKGGSVADALELLRKYSDKIGISMASLFGRVEGAMAVLGVTGQNIDAFRDKVEQMGASAGATDAAFEEMESGLSRTFSKLRSWWDVTLIEIGEALEEPVRNFVELLERNQDKVRDMAVNIFQSVAGALQWFIDNGRTVAWAVGLISSAFAVLWVTTHPIAASIIGIGAALGILVGHAINSADAIAKLQADSEKLSEILEQQREQLILLGDEYGVNQGHLNLLAEALETVAGQAAEMARAGADMTEVLGYWRGAIDEVLDGFVKAYPQMEEFVEGYRSAITGAIEEELRLRAEQAKAAAQAATATTEAAASATQYTYAARDLSAVIAELSRVALPGLTEKFKEILPDAEKQREAYVELRLAAHGYIVALKGVTVGTDEWEKIAKDALPTLEALRAMQKNLHHDNSALAGSIEQVIRQLEELGVGLTRFVPTAKTAFGKVIEYATEWVTSWLLQLDEFVFSWEDFGRILIDGAEEIGRSVGEAIFDMFEGNIAAAETYARDMEAAQETYLSRMEAAQSRYEQSRMSATERFIQQVQREGKTVEEREALIAEAVARGLLTEEEANAARARMTDERIAYEKSAIYDLEQAVKKAEEEKLAAEKLAAEERAKAAEEAAARKKAAELSFLQTALKVVAGVLRAAAEEMSAMAGAQTALAVAFGLALDWAAAAAALAKASGYALAATGLYVASQAVEAMAGLAEGGLAVGPTLAVVGEGRNEEAVLPLSDAIFDRIGAGIVEAMGRMRYPDMAGWPEYHVEERAAEIVNFERMFDGATINVRDTADIEDLAAEIHRLFVDRQRGVGAAAVIR